ncbi:hypothetical protein UP17_25610 (plasmid) [Peribacillus simplex]|uniref:hypothetical protein n=1 Tax=Peribacillus simplex TaxID=1478 RepID=UPI0007777648|nr:hypothetical protein [Peribacillus simplex]AMM95801.1 hypothetical protein UP17_25610 [Peribacillus simplex]
MPAFFTPVTPIRYVSFNFEGYIDSLKEKYLVDLSFYNDLTKYASNEARLEQKKDKFEIKLDHSHVVERAKERKNKQTNDTPVNNKKYIQTNFSRSVHEGGER